MGRKSCSARPLGIYYHLWVIGLLFIFSNCGKKEAAPYVPNPVPQQPIPQPAPAPNYQLVWSDEFDYAGLPDTSKWNDDVGGSGWGNNELEYYTLSRSENARVESGHLVIEARKEDYYGIQYTSARLVTHGKAEWTYGKFEIRAILPRGRGTWPAIWLLSAKNPLVWPDDGELDIMEEVGFNPNLVYGTAHNKMYNGAQGTQKGAAVTVPNAQDSFHVYSLEWTANEITWSVDGIPFFSYPNPGSGSNAWPYSHDFYLILNIAIGGNWGGQQGIDDSIFPQQMLIDWVRVYQAK